MSITVIISIIVALLIVSVVGSIIFTKKEQAAAERRQKVASFRFKADEAQDLYDGLQKAGLDKLIYRFLLDRIVENLQAALAIDSNTPGLARRLNETSQEISELEEKNYYVEMPSGMVELQGLIARLNKLIKYMVLLYQRRMIPERDFQKLLPSLQRTLLKFDAEGHIKMGHQAANENQYGTAKQSYLHAKHKLEEYGTEDSYVQQQLQIVNDLLAQINEKEGGLPDEAQPMSDAEQVPDAEEQRRREAAASQAELNQQSLEDFDKKKKW